MHHLAPSTIIPVIIILMMVTILLTLRAAVWSGVLASLLLHEVEKPQCNRNSTT